MRAFELFESNIGRAEKILDIHKRDYPVGRPSSKADAEDLLRSVLVFSVAALDAYLHMHIVEVVKEIIFKKKRVPEKCLVYIDKAFKAENRTRELLRIAISQKPDREIIQCLKQSISGETFQKPDQVEKAMGLMEVNGFWKNLDKYLRTPSDRQTSKVFLKELSARRDDIVHEGDVYTDKKYHGKLKGISRTWVSLNVKKMRKLVLGIEQLTQII